MLPSQLPPLLPQGSVPLLPVSTAAPTASVTVTAATEPTAAAAAAADPTLPNETAPTHATEEPVPTEAAQTS